MTTTRKYRDLRDKMSPAARARSAEISAKLREEMPLAQLRRARELSQTQLADSLQTTQPEVSKIERRTDLYVSTLRSYIEAMGGELEIVARFKDGSVRISKFGEAQEEPDEQQQRRPRVAVG